MAIRDILLLALVQGLTEFLPVSSSGHLLVAAALLVAAGHAPLPDQLEVNIVLHVGTLLSVLIFYRQRILRLLSEDRRVVPLLVVGTLPAVLVGLPLKTLAPQILESVRLAGWMFPLTGMILLWASKRPLTGQDYTQLNYRQALWIGSLQAVAILPGVSRSGATIAGGLSTGLRRESSATFAFLLAIPAIAGGAVLEAADLLRGDARTSVPLEVLAMGAACACLVGLVALRWVLAWLHAGKLSYFAWYCIALGLAVLAWNYQRFG
jgi:undecaprenyl-diphosphatase